MDDVIKPESGKYRLVQMLGEGLSSIVYKAVRSDSRNHSAQTVALKILKSEKDVQILKGEFVTLSRVQSPYCVAVLGWENFPQGSALVLEHVNGVSLELLMRHYPLTRPLVDEITRQVQLGLADLHAQGLCHGDLSPTNILINALGEIKLVDFGLARCPERSQMGTLEFLAPERWRGQTPDYFCDLYALGLIRAKLGRDLPPAEKPQASESLLILEREQRKPLVMGDNPRARRELGAWVGPYLETLSQRRVVTQVLSVQPQPRQIWRKIQNGALVFLAISLLMFPRYPRGELLPLTKPGRLLIRSQHWLHVRADHRDLGFAPINVPIPYPGLYHLYWRSAKKSGALTVRLGAGQTRWLTEKTFH